ncbi:MAG: YceI family protein, partial [Paracoccaceae bacterium]
VSVKNGEVAEVHAFGELSGAVHADGAADVTVALASLDTGIAIRDERMRETFFEAARFPLAVIYAETDPAAFADLAPGGRRTVAVDLVVALRGARATYPALLAVTRLGEDRISVSPIRPILVSVEDFDLGAGLEALRAVAGLESIAPVVPVTFDLVLER